MRKNEERHGVEALLEATESAVDIVLNGDVLADVPVVGLAIKVVRAFGSARDRALIAKLSRFAIALGRIPENERETYKRKLKENPEEARHVGETLFLVLDRLTDLSKPELLGQVFLAYLDGTISAVTLRRLGQAIDMAFPDDLHMLLRGQVSALQHDVAWMRHLSPSGLTEAKGRDTIDSVGIIFYEVSDLGSALRAAHARGTRPD